MLQVDPNEVNLIVKTFYSLLILNGDKNFGFLQDFVITIILLYAILTLVWIKLT